MEDTNTSSPIDESLEHDKSTIAFEQHVSLADLQRAHTRVTAQLGDIVCDGRVTIATLDELA